ncbi:MAG: glycosyltransferase, partial [Desulfohalobiaceae bacterium]
MTCILFFVRLPEIGKVKTRLAAALGEQAALRLYRAFVKDQLAMFQELEVQVLVVGTPAHGL